MERHLSVTAQPQRGDVGIARLVACGCARRERHDTSIKSKVKPAYI